MYHMFILKNDQLQDLIHNIDLNIHLDPLDGLEHNQNQEIRIPLKKNGL